MERKSNRRKTLKQKHNKSKNKSKTDKTHKIYKGHHSIVVDSRLSKSFENHDNGDGKYIPNFYIVNSPAAASVVIQLDRNQTVFDQKGALNYCDSTTKVETKSGGIWSGIKKHYLLRNHFL